MTDCVYTQKDKILLRGCLLLFRITLDFMYFYIIQNEYSNILLFALGYRTGAFTFSIDFLKLFFSYILTFFFIEIHLSLCVRNDRAHELICTGLLAISLLPNLSMFAYSDAGWDFVMWLSMFWIFFYILTYFFTRRIPLNKNRNIIYLYKRFFTKKSARSAFKYISLLFVLGSVLFCYKFHGGFYIHIDFHNDYVYKSRMYARHSLPQIANYFRNTAMYVVFPLLANIYLIKKKYLPFCMSLLILALLFSVDSQKAVLMLPLVSLIGSLIIKRKVSLTIVQGLLATNIFVIIFYSLTRNLLFVEFLIKRIYFIPAIISSCYFDTVNENGYILFMTSLLKKYGMLNEYTYINRSLPYFVGSTYFGSHNISANTGGFAAAYAYGPIVMFAIILCYASLFRLLDKYTTNIDIKYYFAFIVAMIFVIEGASIISVTIVYGYLFGLFMLYIMNNSLLFTNKLSIFYGGKMNETNIR